MNSSCFSLLWWRSTLVPLNIIGHFFGFRAVIRMHIRLAFWWFTRHLSRPTQNQHKNLRSCVQTQYEFATCKPQSAPYQRGQDSGVPALALLLQTSNKLVLGAHHGSEGSIFLLQLSVITGHLQHLLDHPQ